MREPSEEEGISPSMLVAGLLSLGYLTIVGASAITCRFRIDTFLGVVLGVTCAAILVWAALKGTEKARLIAQFPAGVIAGVFLQPSTSLLLSMLVLGVSVHAGRHRRPLTVGLLVIGVVVGVALTISLTWLLQAVVPTGTRC